MNRYLLILPMAFFGLAGIGLYLYLLAPGGEGPFKDNMVPELIGFCLEGFFLVGLLSLVQHIREQDRRRQLWLSLRGSMRDFLSLMDRAFLKPDAEPADSSDLESAPREVRRLAAQMQEIELDLDSMVALKRTALVSLALAHDLIPVAAQLSAGHMRWWIAIVDNMKRLSEAKSRDAVEGAVYSLLSNLQEFDDLEY